jgi:UDP:flavonoid glycosyltransferase YjiC (YdhE family)
VPHAHTQVDNSYRVIDMGLGLRIPLAALSNATLHAALVELLDNPGYRTAGARLARIVKATGGYREGADWVEYVFFTAHARAPTHMHARSTCMRTCGCIPLVETNVHHSHPHT